jgi:hypothetical protein
MSAQPSHAERFNAHLAEHDAAQAQRRESLFLRVCDWVWTVMGATKRSGPIVSRQSGGSAAKSRFAFLYHAIPDSGFFQRPCISRRALSWVSSPSATIFLRWRSCAFITSLAVLP